MQYFQLIDWLILKLNNLFQTTCERDTLLFLTPLWTWTDTRLPHCFLCIRPHQLATSIFTVVILSSLSLAPPTHSHRYSGQVSPVAYRYGKTIPVLDISATHFSSAINCCHVHDSAHKLFVCFTIKMCVWMHKVNMSSVCKEMYPFNVKTFPVFQSV